MKNLPSDAESKSGSAEPAAAEPAAAEPAAAKPAAAKPAAAKSASRATQRGLPHHSAELSETVKRALGQN